MKKVLCALLGLGCCLVNGDDRTGLLKNGDWLQHIRRDLRHFPGAGLCQTYMQRPVGNG